MSDTLDRARFLDRLLIEALDAPEPQRRALIAERCAGDRFLEAEALELLASATDDTSFLDDDTPLLDQVIEELTDEVDPMLPEGTELGRYRVEAPIGSGGMGRVYLARRDDGLYDQQVAIKVLRGSASADARRRFAREARILSRLDHPNVARLLDAGTTENGQGYLVMEYVDGEAIDRHCRRLELDLDQRLRLLRQVTEAIAFAHRRLILHRDIKPANVLVTESGQVKVLDFGIGLLLEEIQDTDTSPGEDGAAPMAEGVAPAQPATRAFTPGFASPEQFAGDVIGAPSDVWQLGLLLRQLVLDLDDDTHATAPPKREHDAGTLSRSLQSTTRATVDQATVRRLRRGLDAVAARALHADPEQRYSTAQALLDELEAEAEGRPLQALQHRRRHLLASFVRRHRAQLAAGAVGLLLIVAMVAAYTVQLQRERDRTALALGEAEATNELLTDVLLAPDVTQQGPSVRVLDVMDEALSQARQLEDRAMVRGRVLTLVGRVKRSLGEPEQALEIFDEAEQVFLSLDSARAESERLDMVFARVTVLLFQTKLDEALTELAAIEGHPLFSADPNQQASWYELKGLVLAQRGELEDAVALLEQARTVLQPLAASDTKAADHSNSIRNGLANALAELGRIDEAITVYQESLSIAVERFGEQHRLTFSLRHNMAGLLAQSGRPDEAERLFRANQQMSADWVGTEHHFYALSTNALISSIADQGRIEEAVALDDEALRVAEEVWGTDHRRTHIHRMNAGNRQLILEQPTAAQSLLLEAIEGLEQQVGPEAPPTLYARMLMAQVLLDLGHNRAAATHARESLARAEHSIGENSPITLGVRQRLGLAEVRSGRNDEGLGQLRAAVDGFDSTLGNLAHDTLIARNALALGLLTSGEGNHEEARVVVCPLVDDMTEALGPETSSTLNAVELAEDLGGCPAG